MIDQTYAMSEAWINPGIPENESLESVHHG